MADVTHILAAIDRGDSQAASQLLPLVYDELRMLANRMMANEKPGQTLDATALVHEAFVRLVGPSGGTSTREFAGRRHFLAAASEAMRHILVDNARRKLAVKHGGGLRRVNLDESHRITESPEGMLALNDALDRFGAEEPAMLELVKLRFFAGLTASEAAAALGISVPTAERWWAFARTWLYADLFGSRSDFGNP